MKLVIFVTVLFSSVALGLGKECPTNNEDSIPMCGKNMISHKAFIDKDEACPVKCYFRQGYAGAGFGPIKIITKYTCSVGFEPYQARILKYRCRPVTIATTSTKGSDSTTVPTVQPTRIVVGTIQPAATTAQPAAVRTIQPAPSAVLNALPVPSPTPPAEDPVCPDVLPDEIAPNCNQFKRLARNKGNFKDSDCACPVRCFLRRSLYGSPYGSKMFRDRFTCCNDLTLKKAGRGKLECV